MAMLLMLNALHGAPNVSRKFESGSMLKLLIRYFHLKVNPCKVLPESSNCNS